jgi:hypothetical protein
MSKGEILALELMHGSPNIPSYQMEVWMNCERVSVDIGKKD